MNLPIPHLCPNCRHYQRLKQRNPLKLWHRQCMCEKKHSNHEGKCEVELRQAMRQTDRKSYTVNVATSRRCTKCPTSQTCGIPHVWLVGRRPEEFVFSGKACKIDYAFKDFGFFCAPSFNTFYAFLGIYYIGSGWHDLFQCILGSNFAVFPVGFALWSTRAKLSGRYFCFFLYFCFSLII